MFLRGGLPLPDNKVRANFQQYQKYTVLGFSTLYVKLINWCNIKLVKALFCVSFYILFCTYQSTFINTKCLKEIVLVRFQMKPYCVNCDGRKAVVER